MVARRLGPEIRGYYGLVLMAVTLVAAFGHFGIGAAISYYTGKKVYPRSDILSFLIASTLLLGTVLAAAFFLAYPHVPRIWSDIPRTIMLIGLVAVPLTFLINFLQRFLLAMLRVRQSNITRLMQSTFYFGFVLVLVWIMRGSLWHVVIAYVASLLLVTVISLFAFTRDIRPLKRPRISLLTPMLTFGLQVYLVFVFNYLNHRFDIILIKHYLTASDVSFYQIPVNMCERLWQIPNALSSILYPTILALDRGSAAFTVKVSRNNLFIMLLLGAVIAGFAKYFVPLLYGAEYLPILPALYSVIWGIVIAPVAIFLGLYFASRRQVYRNIIASGSGLLCNIALNIVLIPRIGIIGAGIATSISNTLWALVLAVFFIRQEQERLRDIFIVRTEDFANYREKLIEGWKRIRELRRPADKQDM
jgi:O-antigen/teichoic acid export membrane protein